MKFKFPENWFHPPRSKFVRVLFPKEGGARGGDNKPPLAYFTLTMKDDTGEFSHQLFPAGHFKEEKFKKMEEK